MNRLHVIAFAAAILSVSAFAQQFNPSGWKEARPVTVVSAARTAQPGIYRVSLSSTDAQTSKVLGAPFVSTKPGVPATLEIGSQLGVVVRTVVTVEASGRSVTYRMDVLKAGAVQSAHAGTALVQDEV